jgi:fructokinase
MVLVGIGEVLWDLLPEGSHLGGAPANFACIAASLWATGIVVSRVGDDELGREALAGLQRRGVDGSFVQTDAVHRTGSARATLASDGSAGFEIAQDVAWDYLQWTPELAKLAGQADAICFGTLAQRSPGSRETIRRALGCSRPECLRILDVNLRAPFPSLEILEDSLRRANVLKLNSEELSFVLRACKLPPAPEADAARMLHRHYGFQAVCITRGARGSVIAFGDKTVVHPGVAVEVIDTVGAGDAFTAALAVQLIAGSAPERVSEAANQVGAWVASQAGAMPIPNDSGWQKVRALYGVPDRLERR